MRVLGYEAMADIDTGTGPWPADDDIYWSKSDQSNSTARSWVLVADGRMIYLFVRWHSTLAAFDWYAFGDINAYAGLDPYACLIAGHNDTYRPWPGAAGSLMCQKNTTQNGGQYLARSIESPFAPVKFNKTGIYMGASFIGGGGAASPSPVDNAYHFRGPLEIWEGTNPSSAGGSILRGSLPGVYDILNHNPLSHLDTVTDIPGLPGKTLLIVKIGQFTNTYGVAVDITGPWR